MRLIGLVVVLTLTLSLAPLAAGAQQAGRVPRIAVIGPLSPPPAPSADVEGFRQGLRDLGYVEGQNIFVEYRWAGGRADRMAELTAEVVGLRPDVIVVAGTAWAGAAKRSTSTIPIVMATGGADPVATGVVASLARPGGNVTGVTMMADDLSAKRVQILKDTVTGVSRIAVFVPPGAPDWAARLMKQTDDAARALGLQAHTVRVGSIADLDSAFRGAVRERAGAGILLQSPFFAHEIARIVELTLKYRLPTMAGEPGYARAGGLMSYGPSIPELWRQAATYVDKIIKGAKPGDLPIEQPTKFELIINLKTAKALGLTIPQSVLLRADQVIDP